MTDNNSDVKELQTRDKIDPNYKWKLEDIYKSNDEWEIDFLNVKNLADDVLFFKGKLSDSAENLYNCLKKNDEFSARADKLFVYARMRRDEDNSNNVYQSLVDRASSMLTEAYSKISFITPEIIAIDETRINEFFKELPELDVYKVLIKRILEKKAHILSEKEERLLTMSSEMSDAAEDIFSMFNNADIKFPNILDEKGNSVELTKGNYVHFLESKDRTVRKSSFTSIYDSYSKLRNTLSAMLISNVKKDKFYSSARNYNSSLEASLDGDNVNTSIYTTLIDTINQNLSLLDKYLKTRKKALNLDDLHLYDLYVPLVDNYKKNISYEEAKKIVIKGLAPLGEEYINDLTKAFESGWIDVYENRGKTSGAYSWGTYLTHPYVLLNYQGTINDVLTLAHEMGHSMHSFYTNKNQPYVYSGYRIFVAEVASTVNESLLIRYLIEHTSDKHEKAYLINHYLEEFRGTVFRQVMFAEFEKDIHEKTGNGDALTTDNMCESYYELNKKYFGREAIVDKEIEIEWARIPHFYSSFYVYKYATGFSAATALSTGILNEGKPALERYLDFLKSGSSDYPLELLKNAGVDLSSPKPIEDCLKVFDQLLDQLNELLV